MHYQTFVTYSSWWRAKVLKTEIVSTSSACTGIPFFPLGATSTLVQCLIFETLREAKEHIAYVIRVHPGSNPPPTVIDSGQGELF